MKKYFIIELGGTKEITEMSALELSNVDQAIAWIQGTMESDAEYFDIDIDCDIQTIKYERYDDDLDFYAQAFVSVEYETIVTDEMFNSQIYSVEDIITNNLSIVSKIKTRMVEE